MTEGEQQNMVYKLGKKLNMVRSLVSGGVRSVVCSIAFSSEAGFLVAARVWGDNSGHRPSSFPGSH